MIKVRFQRWPWQGYGWAPHRLKNKSPSRAPLNLCGARFGGGWRYKLGVDIGGAAVILNLVFGSIRIDFNSKTDKP